MNRITNTTKNLFTQWRDYNKIIRAITTTTTTTITLIIQSAGCGIEGIDNDDICRGNIKKNFANGIVE